MNMFKKLGKAIKNLIDGDASNSVIIKGNNTGTITNIVQHSTGNNSLIITDGDISGNFNNIVKGNGNVIKKQYNDVSDIKILKSFGYHGSFNIVLDIHPDNENGLTIEGEENIVDLIKVKTSKNSIKVETNGSFTSKKPVTITLSSNNLEELDLSGSFSCEGKYEGKILSVDVSGSGSVHLIGNTKDLAVDLSGSGSIVLDDLIAQKVTANLTGSGSIHVYANEEFKGDLTGSGDIIVDGKPDVSVRHKTGSGTIDMTNRKVNSKHKTTFYKF